nr:glycosyltransferase [Cyanobium sp. LEGE 06113]
MQGETRSRFAFFGQINPYKGVDVLLRALTRLGHKALDLNLAIYGANLEVQPAEFQQEINSLLAPLVKSGIVEVCKSYQHDQVQEIMHRYDWVVVPSIWWENSPMVIQEAFSCCRPVIASSIGGMAEKVIHNSNGILVEPGSIADWSDALLCASKYTNEWDELCAKIKPPDLGIDCAMKHAELFVQVK